MKFFYTIVVIHAVLFIGVLYPAATANTLDQLFLHKGNNVDRMVGYCSQKPVLQEPIITNDGSEQQCTIIIENIATSKRAHDKIESITAYRKRDEHRNRIAYKTAITTHGKDLHITFSYSPARIEITTLVEKSIKGIPTWVINIYDKRHYQHNSAALNAPGMRVVIDCGHGGRDLGAVGVGGVQEKDITLAIGQKIAHELKKQGFMPYMQRSATRDMYIALDDRTTYANLTAYADVVISLHANSSPSSSSANGLETYCIDTSLVKSAGNCSRKSSHEQRKVNESLKLARAIHTTLVGHANKKKVPLDRGIKTALTQMLLGTEAPSVLIELGFVTNPEESAALQDSEYQDFIAKRIVEGIKNYFSRSSSI